MRKAILLKVGKELFHRGEAWFPYFCLPKKIYPQHFASVNTTERLSAPFLPN